MTNANALPIQARLRGSVAAAAQAYTDAWFNNPGTARPVHCIPAKETDTDLVLAQGIKEAADRIDALEKALRASDTALNDWLARYAGEFCEESHVKEADQRISDAGGTLAYIAAVTAENRAALGEGD